jgi:hypothetical protein
MLGDTFHPTPRSRAGPWPVPAAASPPRPASPVGFSALTDLLRALRRRAMSIRGLLGLAVASLHHDHDFDVIASVTGQAVRWYGTD